jgi:hypothetical protein
MRKYAWIVGGILFVVLMIVSCLFPFMTADTTTFTVTDKERIVTGLGDSVSSKYLVFTDGETFQNTDCLVLWKFASSDLQGSLTVGKTYEADVYGWRIPFLSTYRNIVSANECH